MVEIGHLALGRQGSHTENSIEIQRLIHDLHASLIISTMFAQLAGTLDMMVLHAGLVARKTRQSTWIAHLATAMASCSCVPALGGLGVLVKSHDTS